MVLRGVILGDTWWCLELGCLGEMLPASGGGGPRMLPEVPQGTPPPPGPTQPHTHTQSGPIQSVSSIKSRKP